MSGISRIRLTRVSDTTRAARQEIGIDEQQSGCPNRRFNRRFRDFARFRVQSQTVAADSKSLDLPMSIASISRFNSVKPIV